MKNIIPAFPRRLPSLLNRATLLALMIISPDAIARDFRVNMIPNGRVFSCANCHINPFGGGARNPFGRAVEQAVGGSGAAIPFWSAQLAGADSDGDGFTNGQELGDPDGDGSPTSGAQVTNPGVASSRPANTSPTVQITRPSAGTVVTRPAIVEIEAGASDANGSVVQVEFFANGSLIGTDATAPYVATLNTANIQPGTVTLTAKATDNAGASTTSAGISIQVNEPVNQAPAVQITRPNNGTTFPLTATIEIEAVATDPDGSIVRVDFVSGRTVLFSSTAAPHIYKVAASELGTGTHSISARAVDNLGAIGTSPPVQFEIVQPAQTPVTITSIMRTENAVRVSWAGGIGPFIVQHQASFSPSEWANSNPTSSREAVVPIVGTTGFIRILDTGQN